MKKNELQQSKDDAKDFIKIIEKLPEDKKREVLGIVIGYALCSGTSEKKVS